MLPRYPTIASCSLQSFNNKLASPIITLTFTHQWVLLMAMYGADADADDDDDDPPLCC